MAAPSVLSPTDEASSESTVFVKQHESIDDGEKFDYLVTNGNDTNDTNDFPLINNESVNENTSKDEVEGGSNSQLSKSPIGDEFNDKLPANRSTTIGLAFTNFAESRSAELKLKEELDLISKRTDEFEESFKSQVTDDIRITMEEENNKMQDNNPRNDSGASIVSTPSFESGPHFADVADMFATPKHQKIDESDDQNTSDLRIVMSEDPVQSNVSVLDKNGTDDVDGEVNDVDKSQDSPGAHYEKLNKFDPKAQYSELFPPNMLDILKELPDSAENILN